MMEWSVDGHYDLTYLMSTTVEARNTKNAETAPTIEYDFNRNSRIIHM